MRSPRKRRARREDLGLSAAEFRVLQRLRTPEKIQDFLNALPANFEPHGDTCLSVREVLKRRRAHCIEGAFLAAVRAAFSGASHARAGKKKLSCPAMRARWRRTLLSRNRAC